MIEISIQILSYPHYMILLIISCGYAIDTPCEIILCSQISVTESLYSYLYGGTIR